MYPAAGPKKLRYLVISLVVMVLMMMLVLNSELSAYALSAAPTVPENEDHSIMGNPPVVGGQSPEIGRAHV